MDSGGTSMQIWLNWKYFGLLRMADTYMCYLQRNLITNSFTWSWSKWKMKTWYEMKHQNTREVHWKLFTKNGIILCSRLRYSIKLLPQRFAIPPAFQSSTVFYRKMYVKWYQNLRRLRMNFGIPFNILRIRTK